LVEQDLFGKTVYPLFGYALKSPWRRIPGAIRRGKIVAPENQVNLPRACDGSQPLEPVANQSEE